MKYAIVTNALALFPTILSIYIVKFIRVILMSTINIYMVLSSSIISGLLGVLITLSIQHWREKRKFRVDTLKRFASNRHDVKGEEFTRALNEIFLVFNDSREVMSALDAFHQAVISKQAGSVTEDKLMHLFKSMCKAAKIKYNHFNDSFFFIPFNTKQY